MSQELIAKALANLDAAIARALSLGEPEPRVAIINGEPKTYSEIKEEILRGTKEGLENAQIWSRDESEIRKEQREARLRSK